jgi:hypothetical protein
LKPAGAVLLFAAFVALCTLNSAGYRYGVSDQAFYVPAVLLELDPARFPADGPLIRSQAHLTGMDETFAAAARLTNVPLPALLAGAYLVTLALIARGVWTIGRSLYRTRAATLALLFAITLRHAIARSGTNTLEGYFHPRQLAYGLGAVALGGMLRGRLLLPAVCVAGAAIVHPTTALWFAIWIAIAAAVTDRRLRLPLAGAALVAALAAAWMAVAGPLAGRLARMDPDWLATLDSKDYLFPLEWPLWVWTFNLVYVPIVLWVYRRRSALGLLIRGETGLVVGCLSLAVIFAATLPLNAARIALAIQLQVPRIFWMPDFLAVVYTIWFLAEGRSDGRPQGAPSAGLRRRAGVAAALVAIASLSRGAYVKLIRFADRPAVQLDIADDDWGRAMRWARTTPTGSGWLADPMHAIRYGTSLRVAGERDVFVEAVKDAAIGMYDRDIALRTRDRIREAADFDRMTPERARALAARHGLDFLITEQPLNLPVAFQSRAVRVYSLR